MTVISPDRLADYVAPILDPLARPGAVETFHLQGEHDQQSHAGTNARGQDIADVGGTIPEKRAPGDVLDEWMSSPEEFAAAQKLAADKARDVPQPTPEQIEKNRAMLAKSKRPGGWGRGNSYTRRARAQALFEEFGGKPGGSCPCGHCGIKVSPGGEGGFAHLTQDKILTAAQGGTYGTVKSGFPNLIPSCGGCNSSRNQETYFITPLWAEDDALAASAGRNTDVTVSEEFVAAAATGKPVGWDTWLEPEVGDSERSGEYITRMVDTWFGPYEQHLVGGEVCDPATIKVDGAELAIQPDRWHDFVVWNPRAVIEPFHQSGGHDQQSHAGGDRRPIPPPPRRREGRPRPGGALPDVSFSDVKIAYRPRHPDGKADPGEVVWAQVPFEEDITRSKDRPVLIIGRTADGEHLVGVQLTSKPGRDRVAVGTGGWDRQGRESYMDTDRFIQVDENNYRREGAYLKKPRFQGIVDVLTERQNAPDVDLALQVFHLDGQHDQSTHGNRGGTAVLDSPAAALVAGERVTMSAGEAADTLVEIGNANDGVVDMTNLSIESDPYLFTGVKADGRRPRGEMPQVPERALADFHDHLEEGGVTFSSEIVDPASIKSTQTELDATKVGQMIARVRDGNYTTGHNPWVSNDGYILDGHHRWATMAVLSAAGEAHPEFRVSRVSLPIDELLVLADEFNAQFDITSKTIDMSIQVFHLQGQHDQQSHAGDSATADDDYRGGHRPSETGPRIHDLLESEMTDGLDVYENPHFFTGYSKLELRQTMAQLQRVKGDPEAKVTIYRAAPEGADINPGDWVTLSRAYAETHMDSGNAGDAPALLQLDVPAKTVRWAVDDLMEYGYFPDLGEQRIFSEGDLAVEPNLADIKATLVEFHGNHDQSSHGNWASGGGGENLYVESDRPWKDFLDEIAPNYPLMHDLEHADRVEGFSDAINRGTRDSIVWYTENGHMQINGFLRAGDEHSDFVVDAIEATVDDLDNAIAEHGDPSPPVLFRGIAGSTFDSLEPGDEVIDKGFGSYTANPTWAAAFAGKSTHNPHDVRDPQRTPPSQATIVRLETGGVASIPGTENEVESILPRDLPMRVTRVVTYADEWGESTYRIIDMEVIK